MPSKQEILNELTDIKASPLYFLKYVKLQEPGSFSVDFELWSHLVEFFNVLANNRLVLVLKAKQIGLSWSVAAYALWHIYTKPGANVLMLSRGQEEAKALLQKCKTIYNNLPIWMKYPTPPFPDSLEYFGFNEMKSKIRALPSTEFASIGETASLVIHDEWDFHPYAEINFGHTKPTIDAGGQLIGVSTPDKTNPDSFFKKLYKAGREGRNNFKTLFFPYDVRPGRDENWFKQQERENEGTPWLVQQNYPRSEEDRKSVV